MRKIKIIVDSTCDLPKDLVSQYDIEVVPLSVNFSDATYYDGKTITTKELYKLVQEKNELPKTAAVTPGELFLTFEQYIDEGYDIIFTGIGSSMSKTYENAVLMSKEFPEGRIEVVDSKNLSTGISLLVLKACKWREEGKNVHEIAELMRETVPYVRSQFVIDTMEYLHKGGRCSGVIRLVGTILKIKPIIEVREGKMEVGAKPRGKIEFGLDKLAEMLAADASNIDLDAVFITHSNAHKSCEYLTEKIEEIVPAANILVAEAGCVISTHCGPGTIGVLYILKH